MTENYFSLWIMKNEDLTIKFTNSIVTLSLIFLNPRLFPLSHVITLFLNLCHSLPPSAEYKITELSLLNLLISIPRKIYIQNTNCN